jgi:hypothetical protein
VAKLVWRVKLVAELEPGVATETELARIERDAQASLAELGLRLDEAKGGWGRAKSRTVLELGQDALAPEQGFLRRNRAEGRPSAEGRHQESREDRGGPSAAAFWPASPWPYCVAAAACAVTGLAPP